MTPARSLSDWYGVVEAAMGATSAPADSMGVVQTGDTLEESFDDLGFDSLALMEFCIAIQMETGVELSISTVQEMGSPRAVARHLSGGG